MIRPPSNGGIPVAGKVWSVGRAAEVAGFARSARRSRDERVSLHVLVDGACPDWLVCSVRDLLVAERAGAEVSVLPLGDAVPSPQGPDAALALVGHSSDVAPLDAYLARGVPVALVVEDAQDVPAPGEGRETASGPDALCAASPEVLADKLASWLSSVTGKGIALAANFPFCRDVVVRGLIARCAAENALVGAVSLIPGSDLPVMTANQMRLALDMAAAYGRPIEPARAAEVLGVACAGLGWRFVARTLVGLAPGLGSLLRAGVAYGGTQVTGGALRLRLEGPSPHAGDGSPASRPVADEALLAGAPAKETGYVTIGGERS